MTEYKTSVLVLGGGPGGYAAAFRSADLGFKTTIIDPRPGLGGVCLNEGCIPSKALLHIAEFIEESKQADRYGLEIRTKPICLDKLRSHKNSIVNSLIAGLSAIAKRKQVEHIQGKARFTSKTTIEVNNEVWHFDYAIIAVGSSPIATPNWPKDLRIWDSTVALELRQIPKKLVIVGGGIIGLELATIYSTLGASVDIIELAERLLPDFDVKSVAIVKKALSQQGCNFHFGTNVVQVSATTQKLSLSCQNRTTFTLDCDVVISSVGRKSNAGQIDIDKAGIRLEKDDIISTNSQGLTSVDNLFAIGDVSGMPMLAHRATHQGKIAAEAIAGYKETFADDLMPKIVYTHPELATVGLDVGRANQLGYQVKTTTFPWIASGRNLVSDGGDGLTTLVYCANTHRVLGGTIVGKNAGDLLAEISVVINMGATLKDIALTIHAHPTVSETIVFAAERALGTLTDL